MQTLWQDMRYGARMLLIAVITSVLGIGANTGVFSLINRALAANRYADLTPPGGRLKTVDGGVTTIKDFESSVTRSMQKAGVSGLSVATAKSSTRGNSAGRTKTPAQRWMIRLPLPAPR
jgi:hypothetical protein